MSRIYFVEEWAQSEDGGSKTHSARAYESPYAAFNDILAHIKDCGPDVKWHFETDDVWAGEICIKGEGLVYTSHESDKKEQGKAKILLRDIFVARSSEKHDA